MPESSPQFCMTIFAGCPLSKLVSKLQKILEQHGDHDVTLASAHNWGLDAEMSFDKENDRFIIRL